MSPGSRRRRPGHGGSAQGQMFQRLLQLRCPPALQLHPLGEQEAPAPALAAAPTWQAEFASGEVGACLGGTRACSPHLAPTCCPVLASRPFRGPAPPRLCGHLLLGLLRRTGVRARLPQPAQAAHRACGPPLSGRVPCPPSLRCTRQRSRPQHAGRQLAPSQTSSRARCQGSQPAGTAARSPRPPAGLHAPSSQRGRQPAPRGLPGSEAAACRRRAEGRGTPEEGDPGAGQPNRRQRRAAGRGPRPDAHAARRGGPAGWGARPPLISSSLSWSLGGQPRPHRASPRPGSLCAWPPHTPTRVLSLPGLWHGLPGSPVVYQVAQHRALLLLRLRLRDAGRGSGRDAAPSAGLPRSQVDSLGCRLRAAGCPKAASRSGKAAVASGEVSGPRPLSMVSQAASHPALPAAPRGAGWGRLLPGRQGRWHHCPQTAVLTSEVPRSGTELLPRLPNPDRGPPLHTGETKSAAC